MDKEELKKVFEALSQDELQLFTWVRTHERDNDWHDLQQRAGRPTPKLCICARVRELFSNEVDTQGAL